MRRDLKILGISGNRPGGLGQEFGRAASGRNTMPAMSPPTDVSRLVCIACHASLGPQDCDGLCLTCIASGLGSSEDQISRIEEFVNSDITTQHEEYKRNEEGG